MMRLVFSSARPARAARERRYYRRRRRNIAAASDRHEVIDSFAVEYPHDWRCRLHTRPSGPAPPCDRRRRERRRFGQIFWLFWILSPPTAIVCSPYTAGGAGHLSPRHSRCSPPDLSLIECSSDICARRNRSDSFDRVAFAFCCSTFTNRRVVRTALRPHETRVRLHCPLISPNRRVREPSLRR